MDLKDSFKELDNPIVRLWKTKEGLIYKIEIRHKDFSAYFDPPKEVMYGA